MKNSISVTLNNESGQQLINGTIYWVPDITKTDGGNYLIKVNVIMIEYSGHIIENGVIRDVAGQITNPKVRISISPDGFIGCHEAIIYPSTNTVEIKNYFYDNYMEKQ